MPGSQKRVQAGRHRKEQEGQMGWRGPRSHQAATLLLLLAQQRRMQAQRRRSRPQRSCACCCARSGRLRLHRSSSRQRGRCCCRCLLTGTGCPVLTGCRVRASLRGKGSCCCWRCCCRCCGTAAALRWCGRGVRGGLCAPRWAAHRRQHLACSGRAVRWRVRLLLLLSL
jgi:hypothetical protein